MIYFLFVYSIVAFICSICLVKNGNSAERLNQALKDDDYTWIIQMTVGWLGIIFSPFSIIVSSVLIVLKFIKGGV